MQEGPQRKRLKLDDSDEELEVQSLGSEAEDVQDESGDEETGDEECSTDDIDAFQHEVSNSVFLQDDEDEDEDSISRFPPRSTLEPKAENLHPPSSATPRHESLASSYESMGISSVLISALAKMSIRTPTEIQAACMPPLLSGE